MMDKIMEWKPKDIPIRNVRLNQSEHLFGGLGHLHEDTIVDLE